MQDIIRGARVAINPRTAKFEIRYSERTDSGAYRSRTVQTGTADAGEADAFLRSWLSAERAEATKTTGETIRGLIELYERESIGPRGVGATQTISLMHIKAHLGHLEPSALSLTEQSAYRAARGVAPSTLRRELGALNAALAFAVRHRVLALKDKPHIELPPMGQPRELWLDEDQEAEFHARAMGLSIGRATLDPISLFVSIALDTGARKGAIEGLTPARVRLDGDGHGLIDFREPGRRVHNKRRVAVPIAARLRPTIERAMREARGPDRPLISLARIDKVFAAWADTTPWPWVTPNVLRHTYGTLAMRANADPYQTAGMMGDTVATIERNYLHHRPDHLRGAERARLARLGLDV